MVELVMMLVLGVTIAFLPFIALALDAIVNPQK